MREGVVTHYLPLGPAGEKGIDVWLALEAYERAIDRRFQVLALLTCDGDFLPLARKLNALGTRVMLLGWTFKWTDENAQERETRTSQALLEEVTYPLLMHALVDDPKRQDDPGINGLFLPPRESPPAPTAATAEVSAGDLLEGRVQNLKDGYGFITPAGGGPNLFFFHDSMRGGDFNELALGDRVRFRLGANQRGACAIDVERHWPGLVEH
jgi:cold shock CspA family protein